MLEFLLNCTAWGMAATGRKMVNVGAQLQQAGWRLASDGQKVQKLSSLIGPQ